MNRPSKKLNLTLEPRIVQDNQPLEVIPRLFIGSIHAAFNQETLLERGITHIHNSSRIPATFPKQFTYLSIDIHDKEDANILSCIPASNIFIEAGMDAGGVLVHCFGGKSRSAAFIVAFLMSSRGLTFDAALTVVVAARPVASVNKGFERQLRAYMQTNYDVYASQQVLLRCRVRALHRLRGANKIELLPTGAGGGGGGGGGEMLMSPLASSSSSSSSSSGHKRSRGATKSGSIGQCGGEDVDEVEEDPALFCDPRTMTTLVTESPSHIIHGEGPAPNCRLSRPGSSSVRIIPPLRGLERRYCCSWCGTSLFSLANVIRVDGFGSSSLVGNSGGGGGGGGGAASFSSSAYAEDKRGLGEGLPPHIAQTNHFTNMDPPSPKMSPNSSARRRIDAKHTGSKMYWEQPLSAPPQLVFPTSTRARQTGVSSFDFDPASYGSSSSSSSSSSFSSSFSSRMEEADSKDPTSSSGGGSMYKGDASPSPSPTASSFSTSSFGGGGGGGGGISRQNELRLRLGGQSKDLAFPDDSPRIPLPPHFASGGDEAGMEVSSSSYLDEGNCERPQSVEKRRWLARMSLLRGGSDVATGGSDAKAAKLAAEDYAASEQVEGSGKYLFLEYLEWMGSAVLSGEEDGEIACKNCSKPIGTWSWKPTTRQCLDGLLESPLFRILRASVHQADLPLDATPSNTPRIDEE